MDEPLTNDDTARSREVVERIAANVRAELARAEVSPGAVAELLRIHPNTVTGRLAGRAPFYAYEIALLAARLSVSVESLMNMGQSSLGQGVPRGTGPGYLGPVVGGDR